MEDNQLLGWRPSWAPSDPREDLEAARAEMKRSPYDHDHDGRCDDHVCTGIELVVDDQWPAAFTAPTERSFAQIGFSVRVRPLGKFTTYPGAQLPPAHTPMNSNNWRADYPNGSNFFPLLMSGTNLTDGSGSTFDFPLLGATGAQLKKWGYRITTVPDVDPRIDQCAAELSEAQATCWAGLDRHLMEEVVPWIPFLFESSIRVFSKRVRSFSFDQFIGYPALDRIALKPAST